MDRDGFRQFLQEREIPEDQIEPFISLVERFEDFVQTKEAPTGDDVRAFSEILIKKKLNTFDNYRALALYGRFQKNDEVYVAIVELVDGAEALDNLYEKVGQMVGEQKRDEIFAGIDLPPMGTPSTEKPAATQAIMERLEGMVDAETCKEILSGSLRYLEDEWFLEGREKYLACKNLDEFLEKKGDEFIAQLEQIKNEGGLFFTQEITDEVIEFVQSHPEIRQGVREGNVLHEAKIPYMTREYLAETDERLKRYYYCHCPWVRESLRTGDVDVSPTFCNCSSGFHKKSWEVIFDQPLKAEVVEAVLQGDPWCKFAIHLPDNLE